MTFSAKRKSRRKRYEACDDVVNSEEVKIGKLLSKLANFCNIPVL